MAPQYEAFAVKYRVVEKEIFFEQPDGSERKTSFDWSVVEVLEVYEKFKNYRRIQDR
jgi:hypothetical protein